MDVYLYAIIGVLFSLLGGWISRMCGGAPPKLPLGLDQWIYAIPYGVICIPLISYGAVAPYLTAFAGKRTGHGGGMDLATYTKARKDERLEFIIKPLKGKIPEYWYDVALLVITGLAVTILPGIIYAIFAQFWWGLIIIFSGLFKPLAYMIGWAIFPDGSDDDPENSELDEATEIGEFLNGALSYAALYPPISLVIIQLIERLL